MKPSMLLLIITLFFAGCNIDELFYGPETDPGLYTRHQIERMTAFWKRQGFTQVYWRSEDLPVPD